MKTTAVFLAVFMMAVTALHGSVELLVGLEGPAREPEFNKTQEWLGIQYTHDQPVFRSFRIYGKALMGTNSSDEFLLAAGLAYTWFPLQDNGNFSIRIQTGPSYTEVRWPHTGTDFNWTTDVNLAYRGFFIGYSHTSNAGLGNPNSGLDMILLGYSVRWN